MMVEWWFHYFIMEEFSKNKTNRALKVLVDKRRGDISSRKIYLQLLNNHIYKNAENTYCAWGESCNILQDHLSFRTKYIFLHYKKWVLYIGTQAAKVDVCNYPGGPLQISDLAHPGNQGSTALTGILLYFYYIFIINPIFGLCFEILSEVPKMRLKIAMKVLTFIGDYRLK